MAGVLEYFLKLGTGGFNNPLRESEARLEKFQARAGRFSSGGGLGGLVAGFAGATAVIGGFAAALSAANANLEGYAEYDGLVRGLKTLEGTAEDTKRRLAEMREVAKVPGLGFEEAVRGDIRLRSVGLSADLSERSMRAFGNALATIGGGKEQLDGVLLALTQIQSKGKVSAEEINQISERVPQVRAAMQAAFGTADTEALGRSSLTTTQFIEGLVAELEKLPQVTSGARNALDNYDDAWKELKTTALEFFLPVSTWFNNLGSTYIKQATRDLTKLKELLGVETPGLQGPEGESDRLKQLRAQRAAAEAADAAAEQARVDRHNAAVQAEADAAEAAERRKSEAKAAAEARRAALEKQAAEAVDKIAQARLTREEYLARKIAEVRAEGPTGADAVNRFGLGEIKVEILERTQRLAALEKELAEAQAQSASTAKAQADAAERKAESAAKELTARNAAKAAFDLENQILTARANGQTKLAEQLEKQQRIEQLKLELMRQQGLAETTARKAAEDRIALEERAARGRRGVLDAAASAVARQSRRSAADVARDNRLGRDGAAQADRLALDDRNRRARILNPERAAAELAKANGQADPGRNRREERAEQARKAADPMYRVVKSIEEKFANIARA